MAKQSSSALSNLASRILNGAQATQRDIMQLAASVLSQDETPGARKAKKKKSSASKSSASKSKKTAAKKRKAKKRK